MMVEDRGTSPSDGVALHRIYGWALKSISDSLIQQSKQKSADQVSLNENFETDTCTETAK